MLVCRSSKLEKKTFGEFHNRASSFVCLLESRIPSPGFSKADAAIPRQKDVAEYGIILSPMVPGRERSNWKLRITKKPHIHAMTFSFHGNLLTPAL